MCLFGMTGCGPGLETLETLENFFSSLSLILIIIAEVGIAAFYVALLCTPGLQITPFCAMSFCYLYEIP